MRIYCSGIGGIGLSAYAALQAKAGNVVLGSDRADSVLLDDLREQGIEVFLNQDGSHVEEGIDLFVYSEAIPESAPERQKAASLGIEQQSYFQALGTLSSEAHVVAVCGTHGKSSTTAMAAKVLVDANLDPSIVVGTKVPDIDGRNWRAGKSHLFLLEACEYRRSFLHLSPDIILLLNVTGDHFDAYDGVEDYHAAFAEFLDRLPPDGVIITHGSDADCRRLAENSGRRWIDVDQLPLPVLAVPGVHMQQNAQLVLALAQELGIDDNQSLKSLKEHKGCWRRMELKGVYQILDTRYQIPVIDDYGHHPLEVQTTLTALKEAYSENRLICVFQPHTHDRTKKLYKEFLSAFSSVDLLIVTDVYDARSDIETGEVDVDQLVSDIASESGIEVLSGKSLEHAEELIRSEVLQQGDVLVCMGAGTITQLAEALV